MEQISPYCRATGHSASSSRSIAVRPMSATARQKSGSGILLYGQRDTDCLSRPFLTMPAADARTPPAAIVAAAPRTNWRLVVLTMVPAQVTPTRRFAIRFAHETVMLCGLCVASS